MKYNILLIDDEPEFLEVVKEKLLSYDYQVITASNGVEGLRKAQEGDPDLIILDIMLPGMDGFELCHRLRNMPLTAHLPILILSAKGRESDRSTGLKLGADEYLTKPVPLPQLAACVEKLLARRRAAPTERAKSIAFIGSQGGVGTSTVVVNVAVAIAQRGSSVILVDLCPYPGNVPLLLALKQEHTIADLLKSPERSIKCDRLEALLTVHQTGVRVLSCQQSQEEYDEISPSDLVTLLEELHTMAHYLLIDMPADLNDVTRAALRKCDLVTVVVDSETLGGIEFTVSFLAKLGIAPERLGAVLIDRARLFPEAELTAIDSGRRSLVNVPLWGIIPYDVKTCFEAEERRIPAILAEPNCPMVSSLIKLADQLVSQKGLAPGHHISGYLSFGSPQRE